MDMSRLPEEKILFNAAIDALVKYTKESFTRFTIPTVLFISIGSI